MLVCAQVSKDDDDDDEEEGENISHELQACAKAATAPGSNLAEWTTMTNRERGRVTSACKTATCYKWPGLAQLGLRELILYRHSRQLTTIFLSLSLRLLSAHETWPRLFAKQVRTLEACAF